MKKYLCASFLALFFMIPINAHAIESGWWWNPKESGRGFSIEIQGNNLFMAAYLYAADGHSTWLTSGAAMTDASTYIGPLMTFGAGQTLTGPFQPNTVTNPNVGTITLHFLDATHATLTWPGGTIPIERFVFGSGTPSFQPETGWWWNAAESGRGFSIEAQGNNLFMAGYMYDSAGNPIWYLAAGGMTSPTLYQGHWDEYGNGQTMTGSYRSPLPPISVGNMTLQFNSIATATLTMPNGRQVPLTRFRFSPDATEILIAKSTSSANALVAIAVEKNSNEAIALTGVNDANGQIVAADGLIYVLPNGKTVSISLGPDHLATSLTLDGGNRAVFSNYTSSTVDITWYDGTGNLIVGPVTTTIDLSAYKALLGAAPKSSQKSSSPKATGAKANACYSKVENAFVVYWLKVAGMGLSLFGCGAAIVESAGVATLWLGFECGSLLVSLSTSLSTPPDSSLGETIDGVATIALELPPCVGGDVIKCASVVAEFAPIILNTEEEHCAEQIPTLVPGFRFPTRTPQLPGLQRSVVGISLTLNTLDGSGNVVSESGGVSSNPPRLTYSVGAQVALTAQPAPNSTFTGWGGDCSEFIQQPKCSLVMDQNKVVSATFGRAAPPPPALKANLTPYQPTGWSDKIVVSKVSGTTVDSSPLLPTDTLYVDWAEINNGATATSATFLSRLYVDGVQSDVWNTNPPLNPTHYADVTDYAIGPLAAGVHTLRIVVDSDGAIDESNEGDNEYTKTIIVSVPLPPAQNGTIAWTIGDQCNNGAEVDYKFYDSANNLVWPSSSTHYLINYNQTSSRNLSCVPGSQVCIGAQSGSSSWGVGFYGGSVCSNCCGTCDGRTYSYTFGCGSAPPPSPGDWFYHWNCNGDPQCLATNPTGQPSGTLNEGPVQVSCTQLLTFASRFWGSAAVNSCDHSP